MLRPSLAVMRSFISTAKHRWNRLPPTVQMRLLSVDVYEIMGVTKGI